MRISEPGLYEKDKTTMVALKGVRLDVEVRDIASRTLVIQEYENREDNAIEAVYCFPIEESAAVCGFRIETDGKTITGKIEEREKAFEIYDKAIQSGDGSFLLDQELGDILIISAGNLKPGQTVKVTITYVSKLPVSDGIIRLQIPTTVSPRYAPKDDDPVKVDRITPPYQLSVPYSLELMVKVLAESVSAITSPSHEISINSEGKFKIINLKNKVTRLDRDFILEFETKREEESVCLLTTHEKGDKALLLRFFPHFDKIPGNTDLKSEVIFILDCSGSMRGSSIEEAKAALDLSLRSMNEGDLFQIICFGSSWETFPREPVVYGEKSLKDALHYIRFISADMGGTELIQPISYVCDLPKPDGYSRDVILLTDGEVSYSWEVIQEVRNASEKFRVFSFGIGYGASHYLVEGIAEASGGAFEMIQPGEKIHPKVLRQFSRMSQPLLTDVKVELKGGDIDLPSRLPPLFEGDDYTLFAQVTNYSGERGEIIFTGKYLDSSYSWKTDVIQIDNDNSIGILWALSRIKQVKEENIGGSNQMDRKGKSVEKIITELGLTFSILTEYTSFVAVEKREAGEKTDGQPEFKRIPVQLTKDWHGTGSGMRAPCSQVSEMVSFSVKTFPHKSSEPFPSKRRRIKSCINRPKKTGSTEDILFCKQGSIRAKRTDKGLEWYLKLLGTQQADGYFTGKAVVAEYFNISKKEFLRIIALMDVPGKGLREEALVTFLAVKALTQDTDVYSVSRKAVKKAEKWLEKHAPVIKIDGKEVNEYLKVNFNIGLKCKERERERLLNRNLRRWHS